MDQGGQAVETDATGFQMSYAKDLLLHSHKFLHPFENANLVISTGG